MKWLNVRLILVREARDQLRDRRTLFMIAVLPLLLYPLLGMVFVQVSQFLREHPTRVWVIGASALPDDPPLLAGGRFAAEFCPEDEARLLIMQVLPSPPADPSWRPRAAAERHIESGVCDAVVYFPPEFAAKLERSRSELASPRQSQSGTAANARVQVPQPIIFHTRASDKSQIAYNRVETVLRRWREAIVRQNLQESHISPAATEPFELDQADVSEDVSRRAAVWSKILPFVVLIWALTGAFYPAIDLCAGEKERGTLETLLSSPAQRTEIVWGKLLTVMAFSAATSLLNLVSVGLTGAFIIKRLGETAGHALLGPPPLFALVWLLLALVPISALFSALSLAIAAFARSSKEGQYYLMPLLLITLPLMMLPLLPSVELDWGTSLIPVAGIMLLLRSLIEGQYAAAIWYAGPVAAVTAICCLLAIRWAVDQFSNESVLFRESERWDPGIWLRHLVRDREETPTFGQAALCGVLLLLISFFGSLHVATPKTWSGVATVVVATQVAFFATPALLMAIMLTRSPRKTLLLCLPRPLTLPVAALLALLLHPSIILLGRGIELLYPLSSEKLQALEPYAKAMQEAPLGYVLLLVAVVPAICEELAFRGFILSGLRHMGHKWTAIVLSSIFFGVAHGLLQQSLAAIAVGVVIGYVVVQSGSLLPGVLFHLTHNALLILAGRITPELVANHPVLGWLVHASGDPAQAQFECRWPFVLVGGAASLILLLWLHGLPYQAYAEEELQEALDRQEGERRDPATGA